MFLKKIFKNPFAKKTTESHAIPKDPKASKPLAKNPKTIIFASYPEKKVDRKYIDVFWKKYFNGNLKEAISKRKDSSVISSYNTNVKILPLSPTVAVTVRKMNNGRRYLKIKEYFENKFKEYKSKNFEAVFSDIIDYKIKDGNYYIMERIIPSVTLLDLLHYRHSDKILHKNRFSKSFSRTIQKMDKKTFEKMYIDLSKAVEEFYDIDRKIHLENNKTGTLDSGETNIIVIDYNPTIGKFKFGLIDLKNILSSSF